MVLVMLLCNILSRLMFDMQIARYKEVAFFMG